MHALDDQDFSDIIDGAVEAGFLEAGSTAHGIALQVRDHGEESLSDKQKAVYTSRTVPALRNYGEMCEKQRVAALLARDCPP